MSRQIEIRDILNYRFPENLQYSPDGSVLGFQVARADEKKNDYRRDVWMARDGSVKQMTHTLNASLVCWKDNTHMILSRHIAHEEAGVTKLYLLDVNGGEAEEWITLPFAMGSLEQVNENLYIASAVIKKSDPDAWKDSEEQRKAKQDAAKKETDYQVIDEVPYWFNGRNFINGQRTALFTVNTKNGLQIKRIAPAAFDLTSLKVSGKIVYYAGIAWNGYNDMLSQKLYAYHTDSGKTDTLYGKKDYTIGSILVLKKQLYVLASNLKEYGCNETLKFHKVTKNGLELVKDPQRSLYNSVAVDTALGSGKSSQVSGDCFYTIASDEDRSGIWKYDSSFRKSVLFKEPGAVFFLDASIDKVAFAYESSTSLMEVYEMDLNGRHVRQLTSLNKDALKDTYVAKPERVDYVSGSEKLHGWVLLPEGFSTKKKYPAVLDVHGGPRALYSEAFFHEMQVWCAKGYVVFFTNIRGSDGRGDAFADIRGQYGSVDYQNLMDFTDAVLKAYPNINPKKLCETGGSYGGFMTNWIIGHTNRFACAASQRSISNWVSEAFMSDIGVQFSGDQCGAANVFKDTGALWDHSPLKYADKVKTPTLFIHSDEDRRCPMPEGMQMMQALSVRGVETRMVIFHGENHELSRSGKPLHRIRRLEEITGWFEKHTK